MLPFHVTPSANLPSILKNGLVPAVGPRSSKLEEPVPAIYAFADSESAEDAVSRWLGDEFDEDDALALVSFDASGLPMEREAFEIRVLETVPPERISVVSEDF